MYTGAKYREFYFFERSCRKEIVSQYYIYIRRKSKSDNTTKISAHLKRIRIRVL